MVQTAGIRASRRFVPDATMMKATNTRQSHNFRVQCRSRFYFAALWRISEPCVNTIHIVVADIVAEEPAKVALIKHNHVIDDFALA